MCPFHDTTWYVVLGVDVSCDGHLKKGPVSARTSAHDAPDDWLIARGLQLFPFKAAVKCGKKLSLAGMWFFYTF